MEDGELSAFKRARLVDRRGKPVDPRGACVLCGALRSATTPQTLIGLVFAMSVTTKRLAEWTRRMLSCASVNCSLARFRIDITVVSTLLVALVASTVAGAPPAQAASAEAGFCTRGNAP